jgi:hypothetical protein
MNYDPNLTNSGKCAKQTVELTFQMWDYKKTMTTEIRGNTTGLSVIEAAVENIYDELGGDEGQIVLERGEDDNLYCELWEWELHEMLVSARIVSIEPQGTVADLLAGKN